MSKRRLGIMVLVLLALAVVASGLWWWSPWKEESDHQLRLYGNVDIREVELAINGRERIAQLLVEEGDRIEQGQLLAKLETEIFELAVAKAKAQANTQAQVVSRLEAGTRPQEIRKARADLEAAAAAVRDSKRTYERVKNLVPSRAASQQELDDALAAMESATARESAAQAILDLAIAGPREQDIAQAKAALERYRVELDIARHNLADAYLYAPSDGVVQDRILEVGDMASPDKPVYTVALVDPVWIRAYVSETDLGKIWPGMRATVTTDSFPGKQYPAWIGFISPTSEFTPKPVETLEVRTKLVYEVRVFVHNPENQLRLGMPATVQIDLTQPHPAEHPAEETPPAKKNGLSLRP